MQDFDMDTLLNEANNNTQADFEFDSDTEKYRKHQRAYIDYLGAKKELKEQLQDMKTACKDDEINPQKLIKGIRQVMDEMNETAEDVTETEKSYQAAKSDAGIYANLVSLNAD